MEREEVKGKMLSEDPSYFNSIKQQSFLNISLLYVISFFYALANCKEQVIPIIWPHRGVQKYLKKLFFLNMIDSILQKKMKGKNCYSGILDVNQH